MRINFMLMPTSDFGKSANLMSNKLLLQQITTGMELLAVLIGESDKVLLETVLSTWRGYEFALCSYIEVLISEYLGRKHFWNRTRTSDPVSGQAVQLISKHVKFIESAAEQQAGQEDKTKAPVPAWVYNPGIHEAHQEVLLRFESSQHN